MASGAPGALMELQNQQGRPGGGLQDAFRAFRERRLLAAKRAKDASEAARRARARDPAHAAALRRRFLRACLSYRGVPYARRYFEGRPEDSDEQLFLDCCALVRRACHDLRDEFGFVLGRGNQAYQYCTLPETAHTIEELSPGDLIFYEGEYVKEGAKQQILGMVHVEVFWGGESGRATIGARKPDGYVEIHDDYAFTAKKWKTHRYHFRKIDPWLRGQCASWHSEYDDEFWRKKWGGGPKGGKYSVFALSEGSQTEQGEAADAD